MDEKKKNAPKIPTCILRSRSMTEYGCEDIKKSFVPKRQRNRSKFDKRVSFIDLFIYLFITRRCSFILCRANSLFVGLYSFLTATTTRIENIIIIIQDVKSFGRFKCTHTRTYVMRNVSLPVDKSKRNKMPIFIAYTYLNIELL